MAFTEKYVTVSGGGLHDGSSEANAWTLAEAHANMASGQRVNFKAGTYTVPAVLNSWPHGSLSSPVAYRGYKTTIGDLDSKPLSQLVDGTDRPLIQTTNSSYYWYDNAPYSIYENLVFESSTSRPGLYHDGSRSMFRRCKFIADPAGSLALTPSIRRASGTYAVFASCHFDGNGGNQIQQFAASTQFVGCLFENFMYVLCNQFTQISNSVLRNMSADGLNIDSYGWNNINGNTFYNITGNAIEIISTSFPQLGAVLIQNNVFHTISGDALKSIGNYFDFFADNNLFYNVTGSNYSNTFDLNRNAIVESSDPFVDASGGDYSLVSTSGGFGKAQPNPFEGLDANSNRDIGAMNHVPVVDSSQPQQAGSQVSAFGQWAITNPEASLHPLRSS